MRPGGYSPASHSTHPASRCPATGARPDSNGHVPDDPHAAFARLTAEVAALQERGCGYPKDRLLDRVGMRPLQLEPLL